MIIIETPVQLAGYYKLAAVKIDGKGNETSRRELTDWFPNLITNQGLNALGTRQASSSNAFVYCLVGSGSAVPLITDTQLQTFVSSATSINGVSAALPSSPYYGSRTETYQWAVGAAAGNLSEIGVGWSNTNTNLFSRALIVDGAGNPTTITVLIDEVLEAVYQFRVYPQLVDDTGTVVISGDTHDYTKRMSAVTNGSYMGLSPSSGGQNTMYVFSGAIGAITGSPSGSSSQATSCVAETYVDGNLYRDYTATWGLSSGNVGGALSVYHGTFLGDVQYQLDPVIAKDNTKILTLTGRVGPWSRYVP